MPEIIIKKSNKNSFSAIFSLLSLRIYVCFLFFFPISLLAQNQIEWSDYPYVLDEKHRERVKFDRIILQENPDSIKSPIVKVAFAIIQAQPGTFSREAIIYLPGGPGGSMTNQASYYVKSESTISKILDEGGRDVLLLDVRGTGKSEPLLCDDLSRPEIYLSNFFGYEPDEVQHSKYKAAFDCLQKVEKEGRSLDMYSSRVIASDVEKIRNAIGYEKWILRGHSYGSFFGQVILQEYPETVKAALLSGLAPFETKSPDAIYEDLLQFIELIFNDCASDPFCNDWYPNLNQRFLEIINRLDKTPILMESMADQYTPAIEIDGFAFVRLVSGLIYSKEGIELLPLFIKSMHEKEDWITEVFVSTLYTSFANLRNDQDLIVSCNDNTKVGERVFADTETTPFRSQVRKFISSHIEDTYSFCTALNIIPDSMDYSIVPEHIPVLLLDGKYDWVTPPHSTNKVLAYIPHATRYTMPDRGHDVSESAGDVIRRFLVEPVHNITFDSLDDIKSVTYLNNIMLNSGISKIAQMITTNQILNLGLILGFGILLVIIGLLGWIVINVRAIGTNSQRWGYMGWLSLSLILLIVLFIVGIWQTIQINSYLLIFGLVGLWGWVPYLTWLIVVLLILAFFDAINQAQTKASAAIRGITLSGTFLVLAVIFYLKIPFG